MEYDNIQRKEMSFLKKFVIILLLLFIVIMFAIFTSDFAKWANDKVNDTTPIDTTYNKVILDSIKYNIIELDSTIVKLKIKYDVTVEKVVNLSDSATIELFKKLSISTD